MDSFVKHLFVPADFIFLASRQKQAPDSIVFIVLLITTWIRAPTQFDRSKIEKKLSHKNLELFLDLPNFYVALMIRIFIQWKQKNMKISHSYHVLWMDAWLSCCNRSLKLFLFFVFVVWYVISTIEQARFNWRLWHVLVGWFLFCLIFIVAVFVETLEPIHMMMNIDDLDISLTLVCFTGTSVWMWRTFSGKKREKIDWFHIKWCNELTQFKIKCLDSRLRTRIFLSKIKTKTSTPKWNTHSVCLVFSIIQKVNIAYGLRSHNFNTHKKFHVQCQDLRKHGVSDARFIWFDFVWFCLFTSIFFWR